MDSSKTNELMQQIIESHSKVFPLSNRVTLCLQEMIARGVFEPETKLTEEMIALIFNVSRTPARDALTRLTHDGFLVYTSRVGLTIRKWTLDDFYNIYQLVMHLDALAAQTAAQRGLSASAENQLRKILVQYEQHHQDSGSDSSSEFDLQMSDLNYRFHMEIANISGNEWLAQILADLRLKLRILRPYVLKTASLPEMLSDHRFIFDAILSRDAEGAYKLASQHIQRAINISEIN